LHKQGEKGLVKVWKKRWFVLKVCKILEARTLLKHVQGSRLYYYISGGEQKEKGNIDLETVTAVARKP
jgi:hypothetical protein